MPKVQLPKYLVESRWSRCASIKDSSHVEVPVAGWSWNPQERFAYAPGVHCFVSRAGVCPWRRKFAGVPGSGPDVRFDKRAGRRGCHGARGPVGGPALPGDRGADGRRAAGRLANEAQRSQFKHHRSQATGCRRQGRAAWLLTIPSKGPRSAWSLSMRPVAWSARKRPPLEVTSNYGTRSPRSTRGFGLRRLPGSQGPGAAVQPAISRANLRRGVPARAILRDGERAGDRRGLEDRRAAAAGPDGPHQRAGAFQGAGHARRAR